MHSLIWNAYTTWCFYIVYPVIEGHNYNTKCNNYSTYNTNYNLVIKVLS